MMDYIACRHLDEAKEFVFDVRICGKEFHIDFFVQGGLNTFYQRTFEGETVDISYF